MALLLLLRFGFGWLRIGGCVCGSDGVVVVGFIENLRLMNEGEGRRKGKPWCCWVHQGDVLDREEEREKKGKSGVFWSIHMK